MTINVKSPGLSTGVQDLGRTGYFHLGIPISGGMDRLALRVANMLVGNEEGAAVLECAFLGPELDFTANALVAVTGAEMPPKVDGETRETWTAFEVQAGQTLSFHYLKAGARAYVAVSGGIDVPVVLGSRSTYLLGGMGGVDGRLVQAGDRLPVGLSARKVDVGRSLPPHLRPELPVEVNLRMLPDIYWHRITEASQQAFLDDTWKVCHLKADRIGYRFRGGTAPAIRSARTTVRGRLGPVQHRGRLLSLRLDSGAGRRGTHRIAPRRGFPAVDISCSGP